MSLVDGALVRNALEGREDILFSDFCNMLLLHTM